LSLKQAWPLLLVMVTLMVSVPPIHSFAETFPVSGTYQPVVFYDKASASRLQFASGTSRKSYASTALSCLPGVQNAYPNNASVGESIVITTTVTSACVPVYNQVIVNILPPNSSEILSTAPASPAINTVTAPAKDGTWSLIVQVLWNDPPTGGTFEIFQTTIAIKIYGTLASLTNPPTPTMHYPRHGHRFSQNTDASESAT